MTPELREQLIANFDFKSAHDYMVKRDWKWVDRGSGAAHRMRIPSIRAMKTTVRTMGKGWKPSGVNSGIGTGGFMLWKRKSGWELEFKDLMTGKFTSKVLIIMP